MTPAAKFDLWHKAPYGFHSLGCRYSSWGIVWLAKFTTVRVNGLGWNCSDLFRKWTKPILCWKITFSCVTNIPWCSLGLPFHSGQAYLPSLCLLKWAETRHTWFQEIESSTESRFKEAKDQQKEPPGLLLGTKKSISRTADKAKKWNLSVFTYCDAWATENYWVTIHQPNCWKQLCSCFYHSPNTIKYISIKWLL